ncbi:hypothetical protein QOZ80_9BG0715100 [Eleusine coracana subsp. coracana]|nr:hypothetical protein QOZ80_9BG0715100 [Eleusine coracana subsp. coracana]
MASSSDPVATIRNACHHAREAFSFSSFLGLNETATHLLRVHGYSTIEKNLPNGSCIASPPFHAGGHTWTLEFYPKGHAESTSTHPSITLRHKGLSFLGIIGNSMLGDSAGAMASHRVSFLDHEGNMVYSYSVKPQHYDQHGAFRWSDVMRIEAEKHRKKLRLEEKDCIFVKCEVTVHKAENKSRIKKFLRGLLD